MNSKAIKINKKSLCCGCKACENICPVAAISMKYDKYGFWYPEVDSEKCINCGKCVEICQYINPWQNIEATDKPIMFAAVAKDEQVLKNSSSGGMSFLLLSRALSDNAIVFGAVYNGNLNVVHKSCDSQENLPALSKSKYVQSDIGNCYSDVRHFLNIGKKVVFTGTPCQVAGLYKYLDSDPRDNLLTIDLICHGVPSPVIFEKYLESEALKLGEFVELIDMRDKTYGWQCFGTLLQSTTKLQYYKRSEDKFKELFLKNYIIRPCCEKCIYKCFPRVADITLGDFWRIDKHDKQFVSFNGVSKIFINTVKGQLAFEQIENEIFSKELPLIEGSEEALGGKTRFPIDRTSFYRKYWKYGYDYASERHPNMLAIMLDQCKRFKVRFKGWLISRLSKRYSS